MNRDHNDGSLPTPCSRTLFKARQTRKKAVFLDEGIFYATEALAYIDPSNPHWFNCNNNLGLAYSFRFEVSNHITDITTAIHYYHTALQAQAISPQNTGLVWNNISVAYRTKIRDLGRHQRY